MKLRISDTLSLPIDAVTQKLAFLGRTGSGKSYAATKLCEEMLEAKVQIIALDPVGVWWGLRTGAGFDVPVFGGLHGDVPIEQHAGALIADLIIDRNLSAVIDVSQFIDTEQVRFALAFIKQLFQRKKAKPSPVHLFVEEAQEFIPQDAKDGNTHLIHEFGRLIKLGRNFGIGASLITQRPQEVNKKALNQTECVFAFQMTGPHEREAIKKWVTVKGGDESIVDKLPGLPVGSAHVWSPQWLGISETVKIAQKRSADVSSTPKVGARQAAQRPLAPVDVELLREKMKETIEKQKAEDPKELRRTIHVLQRELEAVQRIAGKAPEAKVEIKTVSVIAEGEMDKLRELIATAGGIAELFVSFGDRVKAAIIAQKNMGLPRPGPAPAKVTEFMERRAKQPMNVAMPKPHAAPPDGSAPSGGVRRMMIALAQRPGLNDRQLGVRAALSSRSGTFRNYLGKLRTNGWMDGSRERMELTPAGIQALGDYEPLPVGRALLDHWLAELGGGTARMLSCLAESYPNAMSFDELGAAAEISSASGTFRNYLGKLRSLELITGKRNDLRATDEFFE